MTDSNVKTPYFNPHLTPSLSMTRRKMVMLSVVEVVSALGRQSPCLDHLALMLNTFWEMALTHSNGQINVSNQEWRDLAYSIGLGNDALRGCSSDEETLESLTLEVASRLIDLYHDGLHERTWAPKMVLTIGKLAKTLNWAREKNLSGPSPMDEDHILALLNQQISMGLVGPFMSPYVGLKAANAKAA